MCLKTYALLCLFQELNGEGNDEAHNVRKLLTWYYTHDTSWSMSACQYPWNRKRNLGNPYLDDFDISFSTR